MRWAWGISEIVVRKGTGPGRSPAYLCVGGVFRHSEVLDR